MNNRVWVETHQVVWFVYFDFSSLLALVGGCCGSSSVFVCVCVYYRLVKRSVPGVWTLEKRMCVYVCRESNCQPSCSQVRFLSSDTQSWNVLSQRYDSCVCVCLCVYGQVEMFFSLFRFLFPCSSLFCVVFRDGGPLGILFIWNTWLHLSVGPIYSLIAPLFKWHIQVYYTYKYIIIYDTYTGPGEMTNNQCIWMSNCQGSWRQPMQTTADQNKKKARKKVFQKTIDFQFNCVYVRVCVMMTIMLTTKMTIKSAVRSTKEFPV